MIAGLFFSKFSIPSLYQAIEANDKHVFSYVCEIKNMAVKG